MHIVYGFHATLFGECLLSLTERDVCGLTFHDARGQDDALAQLRAAWPGATLMPDFAKTEAVAAHLFSAAADATKPLNLLVRGTNFQIKVWEALLRIPSGGMVSYQDIATALGQPRASQAVGGAVEANAIGYLIPCHRVIQQHGGPGGYRRGVARK